MSSLKFGIDRILHFVKTRYMAKKVKKSKSSDVKITWHFFVPGAVAGVIAWLFSQSFVLGFEIFAVTVIATWVIRKYGRE